MPEHDPRAFEERVRREYERLRRSEGSTGKALAGSVAALPSELRAVAQAASTVIAERFANATAVGAPESREQSDALSAMLRRHLGVGFVPPPTYAVFRLHPRHGAGFCRHSLGRDLAFAVPGPEASMVRFTARSVQSLVECDLEQPVIVAARDSDLLVGIRVADIPAGEALPDPADAPSRISLFADFESGSQLTIDRLRCREWRRLEPTGEEGPHERPELGSEWADPDRLDADDMALFAPDLLPLTADSPFESSFINLPFCLFRKAIPFQVREDLPSAVWFAIHWGPDAERAAKLIGPRLLPNCATAWNMVYNRVDSHQLTWTDDHRAVLIQSPSGLEAAAGFVVHAVETESGIRWYDRRRVIRPGLPSYVVAPSEREGVLGEIRFPEPDLRVTIAFSVYNSAAVASGLPPGPIFPASDSQSQEYGVASAESLVTTASVDLDVDNETLWTRFLAHHGSRHALVTRQDVRAAIATFVPFGLDRVVRRRGIRFESRAGRLKGAHIPFTDILIPLAPSDLGQEDREGCLAQLTAHLARRMPLNAMFRIRFVE